MIDSIQTIRQSFQTSRTNEKMRHRDIAQQLAMSEGELIATFTGINTIPLEIGEMQAIRL